MISPGLGLNEEIQSVTPVQDLFLRHDHVVAIPFVLELVAVS